MLCAKYLTFSNDFMFLKIWLHTSKFCKFAPTLCESKTRCFLPSLTKNQQIAFSVALLPEIRPFWELLLNSLNWLRVRFLIPKYKHWILTPNVKNRRLVSNIWLFQIIWCSSKFDGKLQILQVYMRAHPMGIKSIMPFLLPWCRKSGHSTGVSCIFLFSVDSDCCRYNYQLQKLCRKLAITSGIRRFSADIAAALKRSQKAPN